jgi:hypothetical protein
MLRAQQLYLGTEDIIGHVSSVPDSLSITKDISAFHEVDNPEKLAFRPILEQDISHDAHLKKLGYLYVKMGSKNFADIKFGMLNRENPAINFSGGHYFSDNQPFIASRTHFLWDPAMYYFDMGIRPSLFFDISKHEREQMVKVSHDFSADDPMEHLVGKSEMYVVGFSLTSKPPNADAIDNIRFSAKLIGHDDSYRKDSHTEINIGTTFSRFLFTAGTDLDIFFHYDKFHGQSNIFLSTPVIDILGLHVSGSKHIYPSLYIEKSFYLSDYSEVSVSNLPQMYAPSLYDYYREMPYTRGRIFDDQMIWYAQQTPWNAYLTFNLFYPLEMQLYLNSKYTKNRHYVVAWELATEDTTCSRYLYAWSWNDIWEHSLNASIIKRLPHFTFAGKTKYAHYLLTQDATHDRLPWEPHLKFSLSADYHFRKFTTGFSASQLMYRYDNRDVKLPDVFLLSHHSSLDINRHFKLTLDLHNLLDQKFYNHIHGLQKDGFFAELGLRVLF